MYNAYEKDLAVVNLFFGDSTAFGEHLTYHTLVKTVLQLRLPCNLAFPSEFERAPKMTWLDFISNLGGICGLCLGISFVSVTEFVYWFSIRLCRSFVMR